MAAKKKSPAKPASKPAPQVKGKALEKPAAKAAAKTVAKPSSPEPAKAQTKSTAAAAEKLKPVAKAPVAKAQATKQPISAPAAAANAARASGAATSGAKSTRPPSPPSSTRPTRPQMPAAPPPPLAPPATSAAKRPSGDLDDIEEPDDLDLAEVADVADLAELADVSETADAADVADGVEDAPPAPAAAPAAPARPPRPPAPRGKSAPRKSLALDDDDLSTDDDDDDEGAQEDDAGQREDAPADEVPEQAAVAAATPPVPAKKVAAPRPVPPLPPRKPGVITFAFSPDADDAFMVYALVHGKIDLEDRRYELTRADIAKLNDEAKKGTYDVTAFSFGAWPGMADRYLVLPCGGSFGDHVGPVVVSKTPVRSNEVRGLHVAVPGLNTTAALVLRMWLHPNKLDLHSAPFDRIVGLVRDGKARAGVLIHESQLTVKTDGLTRVVDLGLWWGEKTEGLPLPLGGNAVRRDIPPEERAKIALDLKRSIAYALGHREEALEYAQQFSRGLPRPLLDKYVSMYVNELTLDFGERGRQAVHALYAEAVRLGLQKQVTELEFS